MPSDRKSKRIEPGIWREREGNGYIVEVSYNDPHTGKRVREYRTVNRIDLAREWRQSRKTDALRDEVRGGKKKRTIMPFYKFADEYFKVWSLRCKPSTVRGRKDSHQGGSEALLWEESNTHYHMKGHRNLYHPTPGKGHQEFYHQSGIVSAQEYVLESR